MLNDASNQYNISPVINACSVGRVDFVHLAIFGMWCAVNNSEANCIWSMLCPYVVTSLLSSLSINTTHMNVYCQNHIDVKF